jgi:hypothetical protein
MLRRILGSKSEEATRGWRKLRNEELHNLCSLPKSRRRRWRRMEEMKQNWRDIVSGLHHCTIAELA